MGRPRMPRFLLKLPSEVRDEARLWVDRPPIEMGEGLEAFEGRCRGGEAVVERTGGDEMRFCRGGDAGCRRCCSSGGLSGVLSWLASYTTLDDLASCSITAA